MQSRYKKIDFKDFLGGRGQIFSDSSDPKKFLVSNQIVADLFTKKLKLAFDTNYQTLAYGSNSDGKILEVYGDISSLWTRVIAYDYNTTNEMRLLGRGDNYGVFSDLNTVEVGGYVENDYLVFFKGKMLAFYEGRYSYVAVGNTWVHMGAWITSHMPIHHCISADGWLYLVNGYGNIYRSFDGLVWEVYFDGYSVGVRFNAVADLGGFLYGIMSQGGFVRNSLIRFENGIPVVLYNFYNDNVQSSLLSFCDYLVIADVIDGKIVLYKYDKSQLEQIGLIDDHVFSGVSLFYSSYRELYFVGQCDNGLSEDYRYLYVLNSFGGIFKIKDFGIYKNVGAIVGYKGKILIQVSDVDGEYIWIHDTGTEKYQSSGTCETSIMDKGKHVPCYLIVRHDPLATGTSVKVYAKYNKASSWSVALLTSNVVGSVSCIVKLDGSEVDFSQFKLELLTTDTSKSPQNVELTFLYIPVGLEFST